jgi:hypothetical protein
MKVFTTTGFQGFYPVGSAAVIVAESPEQALALLMSELATRGLYSNKPFDRLNNELTVGILEEVDTTKESAVILVDGNY